MAEALLNEITFGGHSYDGANEEVAKALAEARATALIEAAEAVEADERSSEFGGAKATHEAQRWIARDLRRRAGG